MSRREIKGLLLLKLKDRDIAGVVWTMGCCGRGFLNLSELG